MVEVAVALRQHQGVSLFMVPLGLHVPKSSQAKEGKEPLGGERLFFWWTGTVSPPPLPSRRGPKLEKRPCLTLYLFSIPFLPSCMFFPNNISRWLYCLWRMMKESWFMNHRHTSNECNVEQSGLQAFSSQSFSFETILFTTLLEFFQNVANLLWEYLKHVFCQIDMSAPTLFCLCQ